MRRKDIKWAKWSWNRCSARKEPNVSGHWGRCERKRLHKGDHALERGMIICFWSTEWTEIIGPGTNECNCSVHDITTPGAAHADDCPMYD